MSFALCSPEEIAEQATLALRLELDLSKTHTLAVLIDPAIRDPWCEFAPHLPSDASPIFLKIEHPDIDANKLPYLLWVDDERNRERVVSASLTIAARECVAGMKESRGARSVCAWLPIPINAKNDGAALARALSRNATIVRPGEQSLYFRYFDPRVMARLESILELQKRAALIAPLSKWLFLDSHGRFQVMKGMPRDHVAVEDFKLSVGQLKALERVAWLQQLRHQAKTWRGDLLLDDQQLDAALTDAQSKGLVSQEDCLVYASCFFLLGSEFLKHPYVSQAILDGAKQVGCFASRMARLENIQLQEIRDFAEKNSLGQEFRHD